MIGAQSHAHRQESAGDPFRETHQVRDDAGEIAGKHLSRPAKSRQHFIGNQQHIVFCAQRANLLEKFDRMNDHPAGALQQRLHDHCGNSVASLRKQLLQLLDAFDVTCLALQPHRDSGSSTPNARDEPDSASTRNG